MTHVVDVSVALKWFLRGRPDEADTPAALAILAAYSQGRIALLQPPHFMAEVCAVLARLATQTMDDNLQDLLDLSIPTRDDSAIYARALQLGHQLGHHLFDTLHHAVALETDGAVLLTADDAFRRKPFQQGVGQVVALSDWRTLG